MGEETTAGSSLRNTLSGVESFDKARNKARDKDVYPDNWSLVTDHSFSDRDPDGKRVMTAAVYSAAARRS
jgi:hypothetical protein